jgi:AraC-like DNA-binding protein
MVDSGATANHNVRMPTRSVLNKTDIVLNHPTVLVGNATVPNGYSELVRPRLSLGSCVRAFVARSTIGRNLRGDELMNHLPASPWCAITWFIEGTAEWADTGVVASRVSFCGPRTRPATSINHGPVETLTLVVVPDALHALTGLDASTLVDCSHYKMEELFDAEWCSMLNSVLQQRSLQDRVRLVEDFIEARWRELNVQSWSGRKTCKGWVEGLALRAFTSGAGRSVRQAHRRVLVWAGLPLGKLMGLARAEQVLIDAQVEQAHDRLSWGELAADAGYADQPHLCREIRLLTGLSPKNLLNRIENDEAFWIYRLWA